MILYVHGKGGSAEEAEHYRTLFSNERVIGFDYHAGTPQEAQKEFCDFFDAVSADADSTVLIANSIGAYYSLCSLGERKIERAFLISPIVNMEKLITDMMVWAGVTENELRERKEIPTDFGETLSWAYLSWVREHPVRWSIPTGILYGENDRLQSIGTIQAFAGKTGAAVTVMEGGEHWFHTDEQMRFLDGWLRTSMPVRE